MSFTPEPLLHSPPGKPGCWSSLRRCGEGHPEKQTSVARSMDSGTEAHIPFAFSSPHLPFAGAIGRVPPAVRFLSDGERNRRKKAAKGNLRRRKSRRLRFPGLRKAGKTRMCSIAPPLHPEALGFGVTVDGICDPLWKPSPTAKGGTLRGSPHWILLPGTGGREFCTKQRDKVTYAWMQPPAG